MSSHISTINRSFPPEADPPPADKTSFADQSAPAVPCASPCSTYNIRFPKYSPPNASWIMPPRGPPPPAGGPRRGEKNPPRIFFLAAPPKKNTGGGVGGARRLGNTERNL